MATPLAEHDEPVGPEWVDDPGGLDRVVSALLAEERYALDTEFHRERTYFPRAALVQLAWADRVVLVDPLAVDLGRLRPVLEGRGVAVVHAANQDLEVLQRSVGTVPSRLFDTQVTAGFLGFSTPSLTLLAERVLGVHLPKANRLTDWMARPLGHDQRAYAAADVTSLLGLHDALCEELTAVGRLTWAEEECEAVRSRPRQPPDPEVAWLRLKEARGLRGRARGVAREVAAWRERKAVALDTPVRFVLPDLALLGIASAAPRTREELRAIRGIDQRHTGGRLAGELLAAVEAGRALPESSVSLPRRDEVRRELRPAVGLVAAWLAQVGRELRIDPALLATRDELTAFLNGDPESRLASGWRHDLLGEPVRRLVAGEVALAVSDGAGGLVLEERSGVPVRLDLRLPSAPWAAAAS
jgi:ribonuclease D